MSIVYVIGLPHNPYRVLDLDAWRTKRFVNFLSLEEITLGKDTFCSKLQAERVVMDMVTSGPDLRDRRDFRISRVSVVFQLVEDD